MCVGVQKGQVKEQPSALAPFLPLWVSQFPPTLYELAQKANRRTKQEAHTYVDKVLAGAASLHPHCKQSSTHSVCVSVV